MTSSTDNWLGTGHVQKPAEAASFAGRSEGCSDASLWLRSLLEKAHLQDRLNNAMIWVEKHGCLECDFQSDLDELQGFIIHLGLRRAEIKRLLRALGISVPEELSASSFAIRQGAAQNVDLAVSSKWEPGNVPTSSSGPTFSESLDHSLLMGPSISSITVSTADSPDSRAYDSLMSPNPQACCLTLTDDRSSQGSSTRDWIGNSSAADGDEANDGSEYVSSQAEQRQTSREIEVHERDDYQLQDPQKVEDAPNRVEAVAPSWAQAEALAFMSTPGDEEDGVSEFADVHWTGVVRDDCAKLLQAAESSEAILSIVSQKFSQFTMPHVIAAMYALAEQNDRADLPVMLRDDPRFNLLLDLACSQVSEITRTRDMSRLIWALGEFEARGASAELIVAHVSNAAPSHFINFTDEDLCTLLWGLARLDIEGTIQRSALSFALAIVAESYRRMQENPHLGIIVSAQCLASSIWAIAKLRLRGEVVDIFQHACIAEMCGRLSEFSQRTLVNSLWACVKLKIRVELSLQFCVSVTQHSVTHLHTFTAHELGMSVWAAATIVSKSQRGDDTQQATHAIKKYVLAAALEASKRLYEFAPHDVSNIAWAIATLQLQRDKPGRRFVLEAMKQVDHGLSNFPPQAISNLCWAVSTAYATVSKQEISPQDAEAYRMFCIAVANETMNRRSQFEWHDLSCLLVFLSKSEAASGREKEIAFGELIITEAITHCAQIGTQALLNIAVSGLRLGCNRQVLSALISVIAPRVDGFNEQDMRQWKAVVHEYCFEPAKESFEKLEREQLDPEDSSPSIVIHNF